MDFVKTLLKIMPRTNNGTPAGIQALANSLSDKQLRNYEEMTAVIGRDALPTQELKKYNPPIRLTSNRVKFLALGRSIERMQPNIKW